MCAPYTYAYEQTTLSWSLQMEQSGRHNVRHCANWKTKTTTSQRTTETWELTTSLRVASASKRANARHHTDDIPYIWLGKLVAERNMGQGDNRAVFEIVSRVCFSATVDVTRVASNCTGFVVRRYRLVG
jgi:hypothetical protein